MVRFPGGAVDDDDFFNKVIQNAGSSYEVVGSRVGGSAVLKKKFGQMKLIVRSRPGWSSCRSQSAQPTDLICRRRTQGLDLQSQP